MATNDNGDSVKEKTRIKISPSICSTTTTDVTISKCSKVQRMMGRDGPEVSAASQLLRENGTLCQEGASFTEPSHVHRDIEVLF